jgi:PAS domain S-box-containing protein
MDKYKYFFDNFNSPVIISDFQSGKIFEINKETLLIFGKSGEDFSSLKRSDIFPFKAIKELNDSLKKNNSAGVKTFIIHKDGYKIPVIIKASLISESENQTLIEEILQDKKMESPEDKISLTTILKNLPGMAYICRNDKNWSMEFISEGCYSLTGYKSNELIENQAVSYGNLIHKDDKEKVWEQVQESLKENKSFQLIYRITAKDKKEKWVWEQGHGIISENGNTGLVTGFITDITRQKLIEEALRNSESKFRSLVEESLAGVYVIQGGKFPYVNPRTAEIFGYSVDEITGLKKVEDLVFEPDRELVLGNIEKRIRGDDKTIRYTFRGRKKDNSVINIEVMGSKTIFDGKPAIIGTLLEITDRMKSEEELRTAKEKAEEMSRLKSVFLTNMSHELRTPMVAVLGYSEILKNEIENRDLKIMSNEIYESSKRLMNTLNLILDLSRIEANKAVINYVELDIGATAADEFRVYENLAIRKNLYYKITPPAEPIIIPMDERIFRQIINNLASNAVKFTNKGGITLTVSKEETGGEGQIIIKVNDTGIGIPKESLNLIFEEFRQVSEGLNRRFDGTGLGLTITRRFVEMMGGEITVESRFGEGSDFTVRFPLIRKTGAVSPGRIASQMQIEFPPKEPAKKKLPQVLLIEDDESNAGVIKFFLGKQYDLDITDTGERGIELTKKKNYDVILMDIDLGFSMSGLDALKQIRQFPDYGKTPIVAVTALAMKGDKEKFLAEGCTHYLSKPFKKEKLLSIIKDALEN